ncbi:MAG: sugar ABC transporter permease [Defluviitaleaceae bacterium]|nr:sugar ABC transporter permease [Defluviitaleaceae bacterium]
MKRKTRDMIQGYGFLLPSIIVSSVFLGIATIFVIFLSFHRVNMITGAREFIGFENYQRALIDPLLHRAIRNTLTFSAVVVPIQTFIALVVAAVLNSKIRFKKTFRSIVFLPTLTSSSALTMIFMFMFSIRGPINELLLSFGFLAPGENINFLQSMQFALPIIMVMNIWSTFPMYMTFYLASLQELPKSLYEAASIDGAGEVKKFWHITIPYLRPITTYVILTGIIGTLQMFDQAFIFSDGDGGPANATLTVTLLIYRYAFGPVNAMGYAAMIAIALMVLILTITFILNRLRKEEKIY